MNVDFAYTLIMGAAMTTGFLLSRLSQRSLSLDRTQRLGVLMGAFCGAMIGAKLPYLFGDLDALMSGAAWFQNGKTILCGLVGGYFGVEIAKWTMQIKSKTGDSFAVPVAATIAVGRLGCFQAQCCYGTPSDLPWAVVFPRIDLLTRHPTQIYESLFHTAAAIALWALMRRGIFRGNLIKLYIILYASYRVVTEMIRPEPRLVANLTAYQWASLAIIVLFSVLWWRDRRQQFLALGSQVETSAQQG
ncbi:prolipoprotein diacylglyceryl transferase [Stieleria varia]|uniref:Prolipoprotein diacylglyceryl transferase n=1 Tax=Stieleria varia TaxID=2528005 RepID=A0A5C6A3A6_9BACT|nr:prolipoprotein diacylglyceryl transferase family protein [Stieleria varia]TWT93817.1 prolipoprotein diacylglyceryl transferase [Stieleria varia]